VIVVQHQMDKFSAISWRSVLLVEDTVVHRETDKLYQNLPL